MKKPLFTAFVTLALSAALCTGAFAANLGTGIVTASAINFREGPGTGSRVISVVRNGAEVDVISRYNSSWYEVEVNGVKGYMHSDYVELHEAPKVVLGKARITGNGVRLRSGPSLTSSTITYLYRTNTVDATALEGDWYKVVFNGKEGYVSKDYVEVFEPAAEQAPAAEETPAAEDTPVLEESTPVAEPEVVEIVAEPEEAPLSARIAEPGVVTVGMKLAEAARAYLGLPYTYGGSSERGFDCSGFTYFLFRKAGFTSVSRTATSQWSSGTVIDQSELQPGDLVFFSSTYSTSIEHVGLYIGDGQFIHSSSGRGCVTINSMSDWYYENHYYGCVHVSGTEVPAE